MAVSKANASANLAQSSTSINSNGSQRQPIVFPYVLQQGHSPGQVNKRESLAINVNVMPNEPSVMQVPLPRPGAGSSVSVSVNNSSIVNGAGDTPEIRKYKKKFNSEILCAALWGVNLLIGTDSGLMLLDRSGQGKGLLVSAANY